MRNLLGGAILTLAALFCVGVTDVNAQYRNRDNDRWDRRDRDDRDRDRRRHRSRRDDDDDRWRRNRNGRYGNNGGYNSGYQRQELNRGYQQGLSTGSSDAQRGQSYSPQRSRHYQRASSVPFREGFVRGYDQGYRQYAGYRNDGRYGDYRNRGRINGNYGGYGYGNRNELNRGYQQGLETGASDGQRGQSYDPQRSRHYRNASTQEFREGFVRGYDEGYRRYGNGRYGNSGIGIGDILGGILGRR